MKLTANGRRRLQLLTTILLVVTIVAIIYTLVAWIVSEPGSFEPLNVLFFAVLSGLTAVSAWLGRADNVAPPESSMVAEAETIPLGPLRQQIADSFDLDELRTLCLDMGIRYDDLSGDTISVKTASLVATMQRRGQLAKLTAVLQRERPHITWFVPAQLEQQYGLRRNVRAAWIDGVLKQSVTDEIALELKLTCQPQALARKTFYVPGQVDRPVEKDVPALFAEFGSLLILGEPGSGKTMTLLQLAERLLDAAEADPTQPTPVVLNLSSWAVQQGALPDWMVEELLLQYQLPRETGRRLIANGGLIYLLDGLDEVAAEARDACVQAINELKAQQPTPLVVCCRVAEYEGLAEKLNVGTAVCIQPLTDAQIDDYLRRPELKLTAVRQMVKTDAAMRELAQTPLFLSVMTLAYRDMKRADLRQLPTPEARRAHLYDHYVAEMWRRRPLNGNEGYTQTQAMNWLTNLAHGMKHHNQSTFYIERLQPTWLPTDRSEYPLAVINGVIWGLLCGFGAWLFSMLFSRLYGGPLFWDIKAESEIIGLSVGLFTGVVFGFASLYSPIKLVEKLVWRPVQLRNFLSDFFSTLFPGIMVMLVIITIMGGFFGGLIGWETNGIIGMLIGIVIAPLFFIPVLLAILFILFLGPSTWLSASVNTEQYLTPRYPNRAISVSSYNAVRMGIIHMPIAMLSGMLFGLIIGGARSAPHDNLMDMATSAYPGIIVGLVSGMILGMGLGLFEFGGETVWRHYILRWLLARQGILPFPFKDHALVAYLDAMKDRIFLRRVGGGWVFIHRALLDYFASLHPDATPAESIILNPEGVKNPDDAE